MIASGLLRGVSISVLLLGLEGCAGEAPPIEETDEASSTGVIDIMRPCPTCANQGVPSLVISNFNNVEVPAWMPANAEIRSTPKGSFQWTFRSTEQNSAYNNVTVELRGHMVDLVAPGAAPNLTTPGIAVPAVPPSTVGPRVVTDPYAVVLPVPNSRNAPPVPSAYSTRGWAYKDLSKIPIEVLVPDAFGRCVVDQLWRKSEYSQMHTVTDVYWALHQVGELDSKGRPKFGRNAWWFLAQEWSDAPRGIYMDYQNWYVAATQGWATDAERDIARRNLANAGAKEASDIQTIILRLLNGIRGTKGVHAICARSSDSTAFDLAMRQAIKLYDAASFTLNQWARHLDVDEYFVTWAPSGRDEHNYVLPWLLGGARHDQISGYTIEQRLAKTGEHPDLAYLKPLSFESAVANGLAIPPDVAKSPELAIPVEVAVGYQDVCVRRGDGSVACIDRGGQKERTGIGKSASLSMGWQQEESNSGERLVSALACSLSVEGQASCWNRNGNVDVTNGDSHDHASFAVARRPVRAKAWADVFERPGYCWTTQTNNGRAWCDPNSVLGRQYFWEPHFLGETPTTAVVRGEGYACALRKTGSVECGIFDSNEGVGWLSGVTGLPHVTAISGGPNHACALTDEGKALCWLADATAANEVAGVANAVQLSSGENFACARDTLGTVACWAIFGLSPPTWLPPTGVKTIVGVTAAIDLSAGQDAACAITTGGKVVCWGGDTIVAPGAATQDKVVEIAFSAPAATAPAATAPPATAPTATTSASTCPEAACLRIGEYYEGAGSDKAIEIENRCTGSINLADIALCVESNANTTCSNVTLPSTGTLAPGQVFVACNSGMSSTEKCQTTSASLNFNGNDRVVLKRSGTIVDAFGELGRDPGAIWADVNYRRKPQCGTYLGAGAFNVNDLYDTANGLSLTHLGVAP